MNIHQLDKYVAEIAKEIVVAKMSSTTLSVNAESGKQVADYYNEIFKGIHDTLAATSLLDR